MLGEGVIRICLLTLPHAPSSTPLLTWQNIRELWGSRTTEQLCLDGTCGVIWPKLCPKQDQLQQVVQDFAHLISEYLPGQDYTTALATCSSVWPPLQQFFNLVLSFMLLISCSVLTGFLQQSGTNALQFS